MSSVLLDDYHKLLADDDMLSDVYKKNDESRWPNGIIPFVFDDNLSLELRNWLTEAMNKIMSVSSVEFVKRTDQTDFIKFVDDKNFYSYVGKKGGEQKLSVTKDMDKWPHPIGSSMHELMHVVGAFHEHSRPDRDEYVTVKGTGNNYERRDELNAVSYGPYDPGSIMHYSQEQGVTLRPGINADIGQRIKLSDGDINALNGHYPPEKTLHSRKEVLERELERLRNLPVGNEREREIQILEERIKLCEFKLMNLPQTSSPSI